MPVGKRQVYGIVCGPGAGDSLGAELILAIKDALPGYKAYGLCGPAMLRAGAQGLMDFSAVHNLFQHTSSHPAVLEQEAELREYFLRLDPQFIIFVGFHRVVARMAEFFHLHSLTCYGYSIPPAHKISAYEWDALKFRLKKLWGIYHGEQRYFPLNGIAYEYVGTPYLERCARVHVKADVFGWEPKPGHRLAFMSGSRPQDFVNFLPAFENLHEILKRKLGAEAFHALMPFAPSLGLERWPGSANMFSPSGIEGIQAKSLELMSLADLVITHPGTTSLEAALLGVAQIVLKPRGPRGQGSLSLSNYIAGDQLVPEFTIDELPALSECVARFLAEPALRAAQKEAFKALKSQMSAQAPERVALALSQKL